MFRNVQMFITAVSVCALLYSCADENIPSSVHVNAPDIRDTVPPLITLMCRMDDSVDIGDYYKDPGARVRDNYDPITDSVIKIETRYLLGDTGIYTLHYGASDRSGNVAAAKTRTVHVVNRAVVLNGDYNVTCSCTAISDDGNTATAADNFTATVIASASRKNMFDISALKMPVSVPCWAYMRGDELELTWFHPGFKPGSPSTGNLSPSKNSFTLVTIASNISNSSPSYSCTNIFNRIRKRDEK